MAKEIKEEIKVFLKQNPKAVAAIKEEEVAQKTYSCFPKNLKKGIKDITFKNNVIMIKTTTPSWRQEIFFFKKEIIKKIHKNFPNYKEVKITIL